MKNEKYAFLAFGFCFGSLFIAVPAIIVDLNSATAKYVDKFQTLIGAVIAFFVAALTLYYMRRQELRQRERDEKIAKATLAVHLSSMTTYAEECMRVAHKYHGLLTAHTSAISVWGEDAPALADGTLTMLSQAAGSLNAVSGSQIASLLSFYQIQNSRLKSLIEDYRNPSRGIVMKIITPSTAEEAMRDAARLHLLTDPLYSEARAGTNFRPPISRDAIEHRLQMLLGLP